MLSCLVSAKCYMSSSRSVIMRLDYRGAWREAILIDPLVIAEM